MPTWGDHPPVRPASGRRMKRRKGSHGRRRTDRGRHRKGSGCKGLLIGLVLGCALWAAILVPLILWGPL